MSKQDNSSTVDWILEIGLKDGSSHVFYREKKPTFSELLDFLLNMKKIADKEDISLETNFLPAITKILNGEFVEIDGTKYLLFPHVPEKEKFNDKEPS